MMNLKNQLKGVFVLLTIFSIAFVACNKDDDSASDACNDITELSACVDCCETNGFEGAEFDLITETCECTNDFDDDDNTTDDNIADCDTATSEEECNSCCSTNGFAGYMYESFGQECSCL